MQTATIKIPKVIIRNLVDSNQKARQAAEKLEDFLLMNDPKIRKQVKGSQRDFATGRKISFSKL